MILEENTLLQFYFHRNYTRILNKYFGYETISRVQLVSANLLKDEAGYDVEEPLLFNRRQKEPCASLTGKAGSAGCVVEWKLISKFFNGTIRNFCL
ncbi:unnamed protein product [Larinioides sclopetarius]|uniref:Uncharacterized protein n=1 Tax=Larinioides sclopetarius TaxID=280406 RepID=A0AAV2B8Y7_9ARAC